MSTVSKSEELQDSWVDIDSNNQNGADLQSIHNGNSEVEKLLIEAQKESRTPSRANSKESSARGSPKSPHSPNNELQESRDPGTDWIWDWSSRPEAHPPSNWTGRFKHPAKRNYISVRNTRVMKNAVFSWENLPTLICSHTVTFIIGATLMWVYVKKYCSTGSTKLTISLVD